MASCDLPGHANPQTSRQKAKPPGMVSLFGLAPGGACHASFLTVGAVGSYPTVSPLPRSSKLGEAVYSLWRYP